MEQFFKSLSKRELGTWIKQFTSYELLNQKLNFDVIKSKLNNINDGKKFKIGLLKKIFSNIKSF